MAFNFSIAKKPDNKPKGFIKPKNVFGAADDDDEPKESLQSKKAQIAKLPFNLSEISKSSQQRVSTAKWLL